MRDEKKKAKRVDGKDEGQDTVTSASINAGAGNSRSLKVGAGAQAQAQSQVREQAVGDENSNGGGIGDTGKGAGRNSRFNDTSTSQRVLPVSTGGNARTPTITTIQKPTLTNIHRNNVSVNVDANGAPKHQERSHVPSPPPPFRPVMLTTPPPHTSSHLLVSQPSPHVLLLILNRPEALNAMTPTLEEDLRRCLEWFEQEEGLWYVYAVFPSVPILS